MGWLAKLLRAETAKELVKRIIKDTLVSGSATLCVSLALSGLTRTSVPPAAPPVTEIRRVVEVEQVRPIRDLSAGEPRPAASEVQKVGAGVESETSFVRAAVKERPRRPAATPVQAAATPVQAAKPEAPVVRLASAEPAVSAPLDIIAVARRADAKPESGERGWLMAPVSLMRRTGQTIATTAVDMKDRVADLTGAVWTVVVR